MLYPSKRKIRKTMYSLIINKTMPGRCLRVALLSTRVMDIGYAWLAHMLT